MFCKDCKFKSSYGKCTNHDKIDEGHGVGEKNDQLSYSYVESGSFEVGDYFGCVHFKKQPINEVLT